MTQSYPIAAPNIQGIVTPVLSALAGAAVSTQPPPEVLPSFSPILRQRIHLLSASSLEPWIRLLTYEPSKVAQLKQIALSGILDPHPVSGEIEVDWDREVDVKYKRLDQETLQTLVIIKRLSLFFRLVFCTGGPGDGGDGWKVGEVGVTSPTLLGLFAGFDSIREAEESFQATKTTTNVRLSVNGGLASSGAQGGRSAPAPAADGETDSDDAYWARYDATPSRSPNLKRSPAPRALAQASQPEIPRSGSAEAEAAYFARYDAMPSQSPDLKRSPAPRALAAAPQPEIPRGGSAEAEDAYFAQYDSVQPAMDSQDPDEEFHRVEPAEYAEPLPPLGLTKSQPGEGNWYKVAQDGTQDSPAIAKPIPVRRGSSGHGGSDDGARDLAHPRPASSASSRGSQTVARLEGVAESRQQAEFGVKQHISRSIRSLFLLSRASGIDREEFERLVRTELDVLGMVENDI
jgi:hypothetical protein